MPNLVNFPNPCTAVPASCSAIQTGDAAEIVYGAEGPVGFNGPPGVPGTNGRDAFTVTSSAFSMPTVGALASVQVIDNRSFTIGQRVFIGSVGYFTLQSVAGTTQMNLRNLGGTSALPPGSLIGSGLRVTSGAQPGPDTPGNTPKRIAFFAHREDMGEDGGPLQVQVGTGSAASGYGVIPHLEIIADPDNIITISGAQNQEFKIANGLWKVRARVPSYFSKAFKGYLIERPGPATPLVFNQTGVILAMGNGYAGIDADGADPQRHATVEGLVSVNDPTKHFEFWVQQESWSFGRTNPTRERAIGVGSNFDDGGAIPVREIFTLVEVEEQ